MAEYIDKAKIREMLFTYYACVEEGTSKRDYLGETLMGYEVADMIHDCLDNCPTADVAPVVHGRWMINHYDNERKKMVDTPYRSDTFDNPSGVMFCEVCDSNAGLNGREEYVPSRFCPNCGARMDGGNLNDKE